MDEASIAAKLKSTVPVHVDVPVIPKSPEISTDEQSSNIADGVSDLELMRLGVELGVAYPSPEHIDMLRFIHSQIAGDNYEKTLENLNDVLIQQGWKFEPDRLRKLWIWLRLNREKQAIEDEISKV